MQSSTSLPRRGVSRKIATRLGRTLALAFGTTLALGSVPAYAAPGDPTPKPNQDDAERLMRGVQPSSRGMGTMNGKIDQLLDNGLLIAAAVCVGFIIAGIALGGTASTQTGAGTVRLGRALLIGGAIGLLVCGAFSWIVPTFYSFGK